jgi:hypothetical protein
MFRAVLALSLLAMTSAFAPSSVLPAAAREFLIAT